MIQLRNFGDKRQTSWCAFCGGLTENKDHCPSLVFLDKPYPDNLQKVLSCLDCNESFSKDEEYMACLLEAVIAGSADPEKIGRKKIQRSLQNQSLLKKRISSSMIVQDDGSVFFRPDEKRFINVITKLAKGHCLFYLNEPHFSSPDYISIKPFPMMSAKEREFFESPTNIDLLPEVGSRAMQNIIEGSSDILGGWVVVQPDRYRYTWNSKNGITIKIVIREYLAASVTWN